MIEMFKRIVAGTILGIFVLFFAGVCMQIQIDTLESQYLQGTSDARRTKILNNLTRLVNYIDERNKRIADYEAVIEWKIKQGAF